MLDCKYESSLESFKNSSLTSLNLHVGMNRKSVFKKVGWSAPLTFRQRHGCLVFTAVTVKSRFLNNGESTGSANIFTRCHCGMWAENCCKLFEATNLNFVHSFDHTANLRITHPNWHVSRTQILFDFPFCTQECPKDICGPLPELSTDRACRIS